MTPITVINSSINVSDWGFPQWILVVWLSLNFIGYIMLHGEPKAGNYNAWSAFATHAILFLLLCNGGFFR